MRGETAQLIALCLKLNSTASGAPLGPSFTVNSSMQYCRAITFSHLRKRFLNRTPVRETMVVGVDEWLRAILSRGLKCCYVSCVERPKNNALTGRDEDWQTSSYVGGGSVWVLTTQFDDGQATSWVPIWKHVGGGVPWDVEYQGIDGTVANDSQSLEVAAAQLEAALVDIRDFAREIEQNKWAETYESALSRLAGGGGTSYFADMCPEGLMTPEAEQLMHACQASWVFGGMGSWNDLYMVGDTYIMEIPKYGAVSAALFDAINQGLVAATNSSCN